MRCLFEIDGKRCVKRLAPGEHVPGFIEHTKDPVTFPAVESPEEEARLDEQYAKAMLETKVSPPKSEEEIPMGGIPDPNYSKDRIHALESELGRLTKFNQDILDKYNHAFKKAEEAALARLTEVKMKWLVAGAAGYEIIELGPGLGTNAKRICPLPNDFSNDDLIFIAFDDKSGEILIDYDAREKHKKDMKWNKLSPLQRLKNAVSRS